MKGVIEAFWGLKWSDYVGDPAFDIRFKFFAKGLGCFYLIAAAAVFTIRIYPKLSRIILNCAGFTLLFLVLIIWKESGWQIGQLLEQSLQWTTPLLLAAYTKNTISELWMSYCIRGLISATFLGHGLYALGFYSIPGNFLEMTMRSLFLSENAARQFLFWIGCLDVITAGWVLWPKHFSPILFVYLVGWGLLTSLARLWGYFSLDFFENWAAMWVQELLIRFPHFLVPLFLWKKRKTELGQKFSGGQENHPPPENLAKN